MPSATSAQGSDEGAEASEFVELSRAEQQLLHEALHKSYTTAPAENGAVDEDLDAQTCAPVVIVLLHPSFVSQFQKQNRRVSWGMDRTVSICGTGMRPQ